MSLDNKDIESITGKLEDWRSELRKSLDTHAATVASEGRLERGGIDRGDESNQAIQAGMDITQADRETYELSLVEGALSRLSQGEFGNCQDCGESIGRERLLANPIAKRCLDCQEIREHRQNQIDHTTGL